MLLVIDHIYNMNVIQRELDKVLKEIKEIDDPSIVCKV